MKIIHVIQSLSDSTGGPAYTVPALCNNLAEQGVSVKILAVAIRKNDEKYGFAAALDETKVSLKKLCGIGSTKQRMIFAPAFPLAARNEIRRFAPDLIHSHGLWSLENHYALRAGVRAGLPVIVSLRGMATQWAMSQKKLKKKAAWLLYQKKDLELAAAFHATAENEAEGIRRLGFTQPVILLPNGVELPCWDSVPQKEMNRHRIVLFMSRIHPKKGLSRLVDALSMIDTTGWKCRIVGPDEDGHLAEVKRQIAARNLNSKIEFYEMVKGEDKWRMFREADLFVLPTNSENFGVVVAESLAAGTPVVTTKGAPWKALEEYRCGWWTDVNTEAVARALEDAFRLSDETRRKMGERGRMFVAEHYGWPKIASDMRAAYGWICGVGPKPACIFE